MKNDYLKDKKIIEAFLFAADEPLDMETLQSKVSKATDVLKIVEELQNEYKDRGINLIKLANKWSFRTSIDLADQLREEVTSQKKLSKAAIETLAIIAYHQPVTRSEIEEIRGVSFSTGTMEVLFELGWVKPAGRKDIPGKPLAYGTSEKFLSHFNLNSLEDLPNSDELMAAGLIDSRVDSSIFGTNKFAKEEENENLKENIFSNIDDMISDTLKNEGDTKN
ncbi:MAG: SMC-Scp complex subunit ScpB [Proteobacteria bacterium]|jgi:segregation and condensation protein B|nr:SMC-Scp complex subunit ScpB [Pseudomonadota bacterium]NCV24344.1 SMC-Scp complex subunit ScpB [Pseudomonadota bacterium]NCW79812.1 SMC-Scp complex subunit ScpB [Pelagibacteraceae bacterium]